MTNHTQTVPIVTPVSPERYQETLTALDRFTSSGFTHTPAWDKPATTCPHFRLASYGCEQCFMSHEEIARELAGESEMEMERRR